MSHFIINEDKDENWKNSEVMRIFAEMSKDGLDYITKAVVAETITNTETTFDMVEDTLPSEELKAELSLTRASLEIALDGLNKIASDSVKYGNEKATYKIELAASQLKDLIDRLDEGDL